MKIAIFVLMIILAFWTIPLLTEQGADWRNFGRDWGRVTYYWGL